MQISTAHIEPSQFSPLKGIYFAPGAKIFNANSTGIAWRITSGAVRLDRIRPEGRKFSGLALKSEVIGAETLLFGEYGYDARAINDCMLLPWLAPDEQPPIDTLRSMFIAADQRAESALALRCGEAFDRMHRLFSLLSGDHANQDRVRISIPSLKDMAEMTGLTRETASRVISQLSKSGLIKKLDRYTGMLVVSAFEGHA